MPELLLRQAPVPSMASAVRLNRLAWKNVDLDDSIDVRC
jgi:hypothetical protein